jgi:small-conductance mechanosensitive channel
MNEIVAYLKEISWSSLVLLGAVLIGLILHFILFQILTRVLKKTAVILYDSLRKYVRNASRFLLPVVCLYFALNIVTLPGIMNRVLDRAMLILLFISVAWLFIKLTYVLEELLLSRYEMEEKDNLLARKVHTQVQIIRKILIVGIIIIDVAAVLMSIERFRSLGTGILASAGVAGLVIGLAAQRTLSNILAGIQIAITQPIRIDDVVIVENEWGKIEEITLTYVVVRIWDLRRLVLPISYFIEKPFQNWTRVTADLLGTVYLYVDYTVPVHELREELHRILRESSWDGNIWRLQVTDATERTVQLRALMSAPDAGSAWNLRCEVREKLIEFLQKKYPGVLPKFRAEFNAPGHPVESV